VKTYKLVSDSIDKNVQPREIRAYNQTRSLHYFHTYSVRNRIDQPTFSDEVKIPNTSSIQVDNFLPTQFDEKVIKK